MVQRAFLHSSTHRAPRLPVMPTVAEPAAGSQLLNVLEAFLDTLLGLPEGELTHTRRVNEQSPGGQCDELAV